jgi:hypothetical protein
MVRELRVATEVASALPASHLAQLEQDVAADDNVCVACGELITGPAAELVVLRDERAVLARLAHPECVVSGVYPWEGTSAAVASLALRPGGVAVATALAWRRLRRPRAIVLIEPRVHISVDATDTDPLERLFATPLELVPAGGLLEDLNPPLARSCHIEVTGTGLVLRAADLRISVPSRRGALTRWREQAGDGHALVIVGRGLGITRAEEDSGRALGEALRLRPCWAGILRVV